MAARRLFYQLVPPFLGLALVAVVLISWLTLSEVKNFFHQGTEDWLHRVAGLVSDRISTLPQEQEQEAIDAICKQVGTTSRVRITVIQPDGKVIGDSFENPSLMDNHKNRSEIQEAFEHNSGTATRFSLTLGQEMVYFAQAIQNEAGGIRFLIRTALPLTELEAMHSGLLRKTLWYGLAVALLAALICLILSHYITRPLGEMGQVAREYASGNLNRLIHPRGPDEFHDLADALNVMAVRLREQISLLENKSPQELAVFSNMAEGVIAIDQQEHIFLINQAATRLLGITGSATGKLLLEVVPEIELHAFLENQLEKALQDVPESSYMELEIRPGEMLEIQGAPILGKEDTPIGALAVIRDISELRRLETVRQDFVANVSHELKTPITTIKGFIETLLTGGVDDEQDAQRFLSIIEKNTDRLTTIIDDLLSLSYLEQTHERLPPMKHLPLETIVQTAAENCRPGAEKKKIKIKTNIEDGLSAIVNENLLIQALVNLVDNAVKYSESKTKVHIHCYKELTETIIAVKDQGMGIDQSHLDRLFERFYRIDKARSRDEGGTGLGLSIVKHIAQVHSGRVSVESEPGKGSTFKIHLPLVNN